MPVAWVDVDDEDVPVCAVCRDGLLVTLGQSGQQALAVSLGRLVNALVDAEGEARREVVESLLRGDGYPSGDYDTF